MRLRFVTSLPGLIEGRVVTIDPNETPEALEWIKHGEVEILPDFDDELALAPRAVEYAIARREGRTAPKGRRAKRQPAASGRLP